MNNSNSSQAKKIHQMRELLEPSVVEQQKFPRWFRLRRGDTLPGFFDHWGRTLIKGQQILVAEPYCTAMSEERWEDVRRFAIRYDLKYMIVPNSFHFPGWTIRILFWDEERCLIQPV